MGLTIVQGSMQRVLTEEELRSRLHLATIEVQDPVYNKHKRYAGYWLSEIFDLAGIHPDPNTVWIFTALDGYKPRIAVADVMKAKARAFVAVQDLDAPEGWEILQQGNEWLSPGPYYLVWQTPSKVPTSIKLPWAYQMVEVSIRDAGEAQQKLFPDRAQAGEPVVRGFKIYRENCLECHSLNLEGGEVGRELNVPKNILEYRDREFLKTFIEDPIFFRPKSKMPAFNKLLSSQSLDDLLDYLTWMGKHKQEEKHE